MAASTHLHHFFVAILSSSNFHSDIARMRARRRANPRAELGVSMLGALEGEGHTFRRDGADLSRNIACDLVASQLACGRRCNRSEIDLQHRAKIVEAKATLNNGGGDV